MTWPSYSLSPNPPVSLLLIAHEINSVGDIQGIHGRFYRVNSYCMRQYTSSITSNVCESRVQSFFH